MCTSSLPLPVLSIFLRWLLSSTSLADGELHLESDNVDDLYRLALCARMRIGHADDTVYGVCGATKWPT